MAFVRLERVWLNSAADWSDRIELASAVSISPADPAAGSAYTTATGLRWVDEDNPGPRVWTIQCDLATAVERAWLRDHCGAPGIWVRDPAGGKMLAVLPAVSDTLASYQENVSPLTLTLTEISTEVV